jgi:hypothetical protein
MAFDIDEPFRGFLPGLFRHLTGHRISNLAIDALHRGECALHPDGTEREARPKKRTSRKLQHNLPTKELNTLGERAQNDPEDYLPD